MLTPPLSRPARFLRNFPPSKSFLHPEQGGRLGLPDLAGAILTLALTLAPLALGAADNAAEKSVIYKNERIESEPWSIHFVKIARNDPSLEIHSTLARGTVLGLATVSDQALALPAEAGTPLAGVNGDFYERDNSRYAGDPRGLQIVDGDQIGRAHV